MSYFQLVFIAGCRILVSEILVAFIYITSFLSTKLVARMEGWEPILWKLFSITIPTPSFFSIFDYRPVMLLKNMGIAMNDDFAMKFLK